MNKREVGAIKEQLAVTFLRQQGVRISAVNFRIRQGEIDLIGYDGAYLVFFEVKYRSSTRCGLPEEAVGMQKQKQICRVADYYRSTRRVPLSTPIRYDVIAVEQDTVRWYQNAFEHIY
jgi:putative endonuclease